MTTIDQLPTWTNEDDFKSTFTDFVAELALPPGYEVEWAALPGHLVDVWAYFGAGQVVAVIMTGTPTDDGRIPIIVEVPDSEDAFVPELRREFTEIEDAVDYATRVGMVR